MIKRISHFLFRLVEDIIDGVAVNDRTLHDEKYFTISLTLSMRGCPDILLYRYFLCVSLGVSCQSSVFLCRCGFGTMNSTQSTSSY